MTKEDPRYSAYVQILKEELIPGRQPPGSFWAECRSG